MSFFGSADKHREAERQALARADVLGRAIPAADVRDEAELRDERELLRILVAFERDPSLRESIRILMDRLDDRISVLRLERMMGGA